MRKKVMLRASFRFRSMTRAMVRVRDSDWCRCRKGLRIWIALCLDLWLGLDLYSWEGAWKELELWLGVELGSCSGFGLGLGHG
jgi:hypothetical protein